MGRRRGAHIDRDGRISPVGFAKPRSELRDTSKYFFFALFSDFCMIFDRFRKSPHKATQDCARLCTNATKKTFKIGTPF